MQNLGHILVALPALPLVLQIYGLIQHLVEPTPTNAATLTHDASLSSSRISVFLGVKFAFAFKQTQTIYSTYSLWFAVFGTNAYRVCCAARSQSKDPPYMDIHKEERQDVVWPTRWDIGKQRRVCGQRGPHLMYICESIYTEGRNQPQLITQPPWHTL